jgi:hypothetical protein
MSIVRHISELVGSRLTMRLRKQSEVNIRCRSEMGPGSY